MIRPDDPHTAVDEPTSGTGGSAATPGDAIDPALQDLLTRAALSPTVKRTRHPSQSD